MFRFSSLRFDGTPKAIQIAIVYLMNTEIGNLKIKIIIRITKGHLVIQISGSTNYSTVPT
jgi:hypothetical protein